MESFLSMRRSRACTSETDAEKVLGFDHENGGSILAPTNRTNLHLKDLELPSSNLASIRVGVEVRLELDSRMMPKSIPHVLKFEHVSAYGKRKPRSITKRKHDS